jgi:hypothetical protein
MLFCATASTNCERFGETEIMTHEPRFPRRREIARLLRRLCPHIVLADFEPVVTRACDRKLRHLPPSVALWQALGAHLRHVHIDYDELLAEGYDRDAARHFVVDEINATLNAWGCTRRIGVEED